jgi:hypothetical protein
LSHGFDRLARLLLCVYRRWSLRNGRDAHHNP